MFRQSLVPESSRWTPQQQMQPGRGPACATLFQPRSPGGRSQQRPEPRSCTTLRLAGILPLSVSRAASWAAPPSPPSSDHRRWFSLPAGLRMIVRDGELWDLAWISPRLRTKSHIVKSSNILKELGSAREAGDVAAVAVCSCSAGSQALRHKISYLCRFASESIWCVRASGFPPQLRSLSASSYFRG